MSHCLGALCADHGTELMPDTCPERGCPGQHGYTVVECTPSCPLYDPAQEARRGPAEN